MPESLALALSLAGLAATIAVAVARPRWLPEALVAVVAAAGLVVAGAVSVNRARQAIGHLAPTLAFLAALLLLARRMPTRRAVPGAGRPHGAARGTARAGCWP